jgi:hypothetical protein
MCEHSPSLLGNRSWNKVNNIVDCNNVEHEVQRKPLIGPKALPTLTYVLSIKEQNNFIALLDTGAQKSYINSDTANKLQKKYPEAYSIVPVKEPITSKMGNGSISPISHQLEVVFWLGKYKSVWTFLLMPNLTTEIILGWDWMIERKWNAFGHTTSSKLKCLSGRILKRNGNANHDLW